MRLASTQSELLESLDVYPLDAKASSIKERTEDLLNVVNLFSKLFSNDDDKDQTKLKFESSRLKHKLDRQLKDVLAVSSGRALPDWCTSLTQRITPLFPYNTRFNLFRACAFGPARSLLWMNQYSSSSSAANSESINYNSSVNSIEFAHASRLASYISSKLSGRNCSHNEEDLPDQLRMDDNGLSFHTKSCDCHKAEVGRLLKNYTFVPRDEGSGAGLNEIGFWAWAERVLDEHAECKAELEIRFKGKFLSPR